MLPYPVEAIVTKEHISGYRYYFGKKVPIAYTFTYGNVRGLVGFTSYLSYGAQQKSPYTILYGENEGSIDAFVNLCMEKIGEAVDALKDSNPTEEWDNVILPTGVKDRIDNYIDKFIKSRDLYKDTLKINWAGGILFYGPPGNGKTKLIRAILAKYGFNYTDLENCLDPSGRLQLPITEQGLNELFDGYVIHDSWEMLCNQNKFNKVKSLPHIILAEDLDKIVQTKYSSEAARVRMSDFLNFVDGVEKNTGIFILATTNFIENLPSSLLNRPGRLDYLINIPLPEESVLKEYFIRHSISKAKDYARKFYNGNLSMAFAEQFVLWSKVGGEECSPEEKIKSLIEHSNKARQWADDAAKKTNQIGF